MVFTPVGEGIMTLPDRLCEAKILLICPQSLSNVLGASAVPTALRQVYNTAHIAWLAEPTLAPVIRAIPHVDEVLTIEPYAHWVHLAREGKWWALLHAMHACARDLRRRGFELAIDLQGTWQNGWLARQSGATRRIGPTAGWLHQWYMTDCVTPPLHATRFTQTALNLLSPLDIERAPLRPMLQLPSDDRARAEEFLAERGIVGNNYIACCLASSCQNKTWVWSHWGELADRLYRRLGLRTVFVAGPERRADSLRLTDGVAGKPVSAVGHTTLLQSAAIVQGAMLAIGNDTGLTYTALAADVPTVTLFGPTDPTFLAEEPHAVVCFHPVPCSPCGKTACRKNCCMEGLDIAQVEDAACALVGEYCLLA